MNLIRSLFLLVSGVSVAATHQDGTSLSVIVRPEVLLTNRGDTLNVKIRLSEGASAQLWIADSCAIVPIIRAPSVVSIPDQIITISSEGAAVPTYTAYKSGTYQIPLSSISGHGNWVCLLSSDGITAQSRKD